MGCQEDPAPPAYVSKEQAQKRTIVNRVSRISVLVQANEENKDGILVGRNGPCAASENPSFSSSESSSIGIGQESPSGSMDGGDGGGEGEEVQSEFKEGLGSMESLENSHPLKRGLSNFYAGKSKSFTTISDAITINDLAKPENPFNRRRRVLMARKTTWAKRAFSAPLNRKMALLPFVTLEELKEEEEESMGPTIALLLCKKENSRAL